MTEKVLHIKRASKESGVVIDTHRLKLYACECGALILDPFAHARRDHKGVESIQLDNPERDMGTEIEKIQSLIASGKKIKIIGAGKK